MLGEHVRDPMIERDPTRSSCPETEDNFSQGFVNNNQTQSGSHYLYTETGYIEIPLAEFHNNSLAWYGVDGCKLISLLRASSRDHLIFLLILASPRVSSDYSFDVGTYPRSSGGSSEESHTLESLLDSFLAAHHMPHRPSNDGVHSRGNRSH